MKKLLFGTILLALIIAVPVPTMARVDVSVGISLPPIVFSAPPALIVLPGTYIYVVPDYDEDIFFYGGWWWRSWQGRWYRSRHYNSGWGYYRSVPSFYGWIPSSWRNDYRNHRWEGQQWNYQRIPQQQVQQNWQSWERDRHWERQNTWGVQGLKPQTRSQQPAQTMQTQQSRPQTQTVQPRVREVASPQYREVSKPQSRLPARDIQQQQARPQSQPVKQQVRETAKPQQSKSQKAKPEREKKEGQNRR